MRTNQHLLLLAFAALAATRSALAEEKASVRGARVRSARQAGPDSELAEAGIELEYQGGGYVPGHVGEGLSLEGTVPGGLGDAVQSSEQLSLDEDYSGEDKKNIRKQYISGGVGSIGSFGGGAGLAGVGPMVPGGHPSAFGGTASHGVGGPCGGVPCVPPPPMAPPPPPPPPPPPVPVVVHEPAVAVGAVAQTVAYATCPGGKSLEVECDVKRPWPQCPPQSYCYATNSVDVGPYVCCPIWSTYGSKWRPRSPFYPYYPPMPYNWPPQIQATAGWPRQVAPAVPVPVPGPCIAPPCAGGPAAFGAVPYKKKKTRKVIRKILKGKKSVAKSRRTQAKRD